MLDLYDSNEKSNIALLSFHRTWKGQIGNSWNFAFDKFYVAKKEFVELFLKLVKTSNIWVWWTYCY